MRTSFRKRLHGRKEIRNEPQKQNATTIFIFVQFNLNFNKTVKHDWKHLKHDLHIKS